MPKTDHPYNHLSEICRQNQATLVAVSKTRTIEEMDVLYRMGQRVFAENRVQDLMKKAPIMPQDIQWHLIGHLQTNKVKSILPYVTCIQSLDRENLWEKIQEEAAKNGETISCLLQIKIAAEETKFGWSYVALSEALASGKLKPGATTFTSKKLGEHKIAGDNVLLGDPLIFTKENIDSFDF